MGTRVCDLTTRGRLDSSPSATGTAASTPAGSWGGRVSSPRKSAQPRRHSASGITGRCLRTDPKANVPARMHVLFTDKEGKPPHPTRGPRHCARRQMRLSPRGRARGVQVSGQPLPAPLWMTRKAFLPTGCTARQRPSACSTLQTEFSGETGHPILTYGGLALA